MSKKKAPKPAAEPADITVDKSEFLAHDDAPIVLGEVTTPAPVAVGVIVCPVDGFQSAEPVCPVCGSHR